jgi:hypothetical protein
MLGGHDPLLNSMATQSVNPPLSLSLPAKSDLRKDSLRAATMDDATALYASGRVTNLDLGLGGERSCTHTSGASTSTMTNEMKR